MESSKARWFSDSDTIDSVIAFFIAFFQLLRLPPSSLKLRSVDLPSVLPLANVMGSSLSAMKVFFGLVCLPVVPVLLLLAFVTGKQLKNRWDYYRSGCNIPRVPERPFVGSMTGEELHVMDRRNRDTYGKAFVFHRFWLPVTIHSDPDLAQLVLTKYVDTTILNL